MAERNSTQGRMSTEFTVWCGRMGCATWYQVSCRSKRDAGKKAKEIDWQLTREFGWQCPRCSQRERDRYAGR